MACNWLMMTSSGDDNRPSGSLGLLTDKTKKNKNKPKAEQETAQPTAARFKKKISSHHVSGLCLTQLDSISLSQKVDLHSLLDLRLFL